MLRHGALSTVSAPVYGDPQIAHSSHGRLGCTLNLCSQKHPAVGDDDDFGQMPLDASSSGEDEPSIGLQEGDRLAPDATGTVERRGLKEQKADRAAPAAGSKAAKLVPPSYITAV